MPRRDGTGPLGMGLMSGRGQGRGFGQGFCFWGTALAGTVAALCLNRKKLLQMKMNLPI